MGGVSKGLEDAGFKVLAAYDLFQDALNTHQHNLPNIKVENVDITQLPIDNIPDADLYHFSPPCQTFSTSGKRQGTNELRGKLIWQTVRILKGKRPKVFTFENVKGLALGKTKWVLEELLCEYKNLGYNCYWEILNCYDYEVVQNRERVIIVGIRDGKYKFPEQVKNNKKLIDIIGNIKNNQGIPKHGESLTEKIKYVPPGGCVLDIPEHIRPKAFKNSYKRLKWDDIPPTITGSYSHPSSANCIHPVEHRGLSDTEALLIQGFSEDWVVLGKQKNIQIGNAVPPKLMEHIGKSIVEILP